MPSRLGSYDIIDEVGRGGMGVVYRARDEKLGRIVAVKVLSDTSTRGEDSRKRLRLEARAAAILSHPSIVTVFGYDEEEGNPFIVYEYVEGKTLDRIMAERRMREAEVIDIGCQVADGLAYAHERGILHRDIKPQNIIVTEEGRVKILDFGLAKRTSPALIMANGNTVQSSIIATAAGTIIGTLHYMAPEQIASEELDGRADIFALGVVLYELVSGLNPFKGENFASTAGRIMAPETPDLPAECSGVSAQLRAVILRCLQKKRDARYPSARALREDLEKARSESKASSIKERTQDIRPAHAVIPRAIARISLVLLQLVYFTMYALTLLNPLTVLGKVTIALGSRFSHPAAVGMGITAALLASGCCGIAVRLYLLACFAFDHPETGRQFRRMFPLLFLLDEAWALTPLLMAGRWPEGVALGCVAVLVYIPITHLNLIRSAYPR